MLDWIQVTRDLMIALVGGLVGAAGGAWGAQVIAESSAFRKERLAELRNVNALIQMACFSCNSALSYRKNHSTISLRKFLEARREIEKYLLDDEADQEQILREIDLNMFSVPIVPVKHMEEILYGKISAPGAAISIMQQIEHTYQRLVEASQEKMKMIDILVGGDVPEDLIPFIYFGLKQPNGNVDSRYYSMVGALDRYAKDLAFFTHLLCKNLVTHGKSLQFEIGDNSTFFHDRIPVLIEPDFSKAIDSDFLPKNSEYESWFSRFI